MNLSEAVLATLAYHDIFDYPLKPKEVYQYLVKKSPSLSLMGKEVQKLINLKKIGESGGYYFLKDRSGLVRLRKERARYSNSKFKKALLFGNLLKVIPTVRLVVISGALAMANSHQDDDIDLAIVTTKNALWMTRFLASLFLWPFKRRPLPARNWHLETSTNSIGKSKGENRRAAAKDITNRACLNLFLSERSLKIKNQNLYTAHEIAQLKVLWDRDNTYQKFLKANSWTKNYLPNWQPEYANRLMTNARPEQSRSNQRLKQSKALGLSRLALVINPLEALAKWGQLWYMRPKMTTEKIGEHQLFFHPANTQELVLTEYRRRLKKLKIDLPHKEAPLRSSLALPV